MMADRRALLTLTGLTKSYGAVRAVRGMDLDLVAGEIHGLIGENGAGKSTLLGMIAGRVQPDAGVLTLNDRDHASLSPHEANRLGIAIVYQELSLCPNLTVAENIFLGDVPVRGLTVLDRGEMRSRARGLLGSLGVEVHPDTVVSRLRPAEQQLTEIARALARDARILILDEPTSSLTPEDFERLRAVIAVLNQAGAGIIFVSHRLSEVRELCDRVTVMRDGSKVATLAASEATDERLSRLMVGSTQREIGHRQPETHGRLEGGTLRLRVDSASSAESFSDISLEVRGGEIVGLAGLRGSGRHELAEAIYGLREITHGTVSLDGVTMTAIDPRKARLRGVRFVPQERRSQGLIGIWDIQRNLALGDLAPSTTRGVIRRGRMRAWALGIMDRFGVVPREPRALVSDLSGGNQQKVVLARSLADPPSVLILVEPTRGIDVATKQEVKRIVRATAASGAGVLVVDSEVTELLAMCDRICVMHRGSIEGELAGADMTEDRVALLASGGVAPGAADPSSMMGGT